LLLNGIGDHAKVDSSFVLNPEWNQPEQPWAAQTVVASQSKYDLR
jgi:hypothetical protein